MEKEISGKRFKQKERSNTTCDKCNTQILNDAGYCLQRGAPRAGASRRSGLALSFCGNLLIMIVIVLAGIGLMATSSCSKRIATTPTPAPEPTRRNGVTMNDYDKLQTGMSYSDVVKILGDSGKVISSGEAAEPGTVTYTWGGDQLGSIMVTFQNDRLAQKSQYGLQ